MQLSLSEGKRHYLLSDVEVVYLSLSDIHLVHLSPFESYEVHQDLCEVYGASSEYISKQKSEQKKVYGLHLRLSEVQETHLTVFDMEGLIILFEV